MKTKTRRAIVLGAMLLFGAMTWTVTGIMTADQPSSASANSEGQTLAGYPAEEPAASADTLSDGETVGRQDPPADERQDTPQTPEAMDLAEKPGNPPTALVQPKAAEPTPEGEARVPQSPEPEAQQPRPQENAPVAQEPTPGEPEGESQESTSGTQNPEAAVQEPPQTQQTQPEDPPVHELASDQPTQDAVAPAVPPAPAITPASLTALESQVLSLINRQRLNAGVPELTADALVTQVARERSADMAQRNYFSHTTPEGSTFDSLLAARGGSYSLTAENLYRGTFPDGEAPAQAVQAWMQSSAHRANILNPACDRVGIGIARDDSGNVYITAMFAGM